MNEIMNETLTTEHILTELSLFHDLKNANSLTLTNQTLTQTISWFKIESIGYEGEHKHQEITQRFTRKLQHTGTPILLVIEQSPKHNAMWFGVVHTTGTNSVVEAECKEVKQILGTDFPGIKMSEKNDGPNPSNYQYMAALQGHPFVKKEITHVTTILDDVLEHGKNSFLFVLLLTPVSNKVAEQIQYAKANIISVLSKDAKQTIQYGTNQSHQTGTSEQQGSSDSWSSTIQQSMGYGLSSSNSVRRKSSSHSFNFGNSSSSGTSQSQNYSRTTSTSNTHGSSQSISITIENKVVQHAISILSKEIESLEAGKSLGYWRVDCYTFSMTLGTIASKSTMIQSRLQKDGIHPTNRVTWEQKDTTCIENTLKQLLNGCSPHFVADYSNYSISSIKEANASTLMNCNEVAEMIALPRKSHPNIPVHSITNFGLASNSADKDTNTIDMGRVIQYQHTTTQSLNLATSSFVSHALVVGATGKGKSNTLKHMITNIWDVGHTVLLLEPAKKEYHDLVSQIGAVYLSAGDDNTRLLTINPFRFHKSIKVQQHIERVTQIFNSAFPMYGAMSALLEEAIRIAYRECGWNLKSSKSMYTESPRYPTLRQLPDAIDEAVATVGYSDKVTSDFTGALKARIRSLTEGIRGEMLCPLECNEISDTTLFEGNCIVNLDSIGSKDTKGLIMACLLMKLQEYRQVIQPEQTHFTVIEEAHNLLPNIGTQQSDEGSNLRGIAVDMFVDSIAEMRARNEGFIIVDQSPSALSPALLKHTNTKISHGLPLEDDQELIGGTMGATESQKKELVRLSTGQAVIFQNNWSEPVLCQVPLYKHMDTKSIATEEQISITADLLYLHCISVLNPSLLVALVKQRLPKARQVFHIVEKELHCPGLSECLQNMYKGRWDNNSKQYDDGIASLCELISIHPDEHIYENIEAFFANLFKPEPMFRTTLIENEAHCLAKLQTL